MKRHDENKDVRLISLIANVNPINKTIEVSKSSIIGNRRWGRIDFLVNHCGYTFIWNNEAKVIKQNVNEDNKRKEENKNNKFTKRANKQNTLTNKNKKNNGKSI